MSKTGKVDKIKLEQLLCKQMKRCLLEFNELHSELKTLNVMFKEEEDVSKGVEKMKLYRKQMNECMWDFYGFYHLLQALDALIPTEFRKKKEINKTTEKTQQPRMNIKCSECDKEVFSATIDFNDKVLLLTCLGCKTKDFVTLFLDRSLYTTYSEAVGKVQKK